MAKLLVANHVTLDGVMQAPAAKEEDPRDGFAHGGWVLARGDEAIVAAIGAAMATPEGERAYLLGRRTYEDFHRVWTSPQRSGSPFSKALTESSKYVASHTLQEPLAWSNSTLLGGEVAHEVAQLKQRVRGSLTIFGSGELIASLMPAGLIDEFLLMIHPIVLGEGRRLFAPGQRAQLRLTDSTATSKDVVIARYRLDGSPSRAGGA